MNCVQKTIESVGPISIAAQFFANNFAGNWLVFVFLNSPVIGDESGARYGDGELQGGPVANKVGDDGKEGGADAEGELKRSGFGTKRKWKIK